MRMALILALALSVPVFAAAADKGPWRVETSAMGSMVTNGSNAFKAKDAKAAQEMADELNKVANKQEKKEQRENKKK